MGLPWGTNEPELSNRTGDPTDPVYGPLGSETGALMMIDAMVQSVSMSPKVSVTVRLSAHQGSNPASGTDAQVSSGTGSLAYPTIHGIDADMVLCAAIWLEWT